MNRAFILAGRYANTGLDFFNSLKLSEAATMLKDINEAARKEKQGRDKK